jgi:hypothetical protein
MHSPLGKRNHLVRVAWIALRMLGLLLNILSTTHNDKRSEADDKSIVANSREAEAFSTSRPDAAWSLKLIYFDKPVELILSINQSANRFWVNMCSLGSAAMIRGPFAVFGTQISLAGTS